MTVQVTPSTDFVQALIGLVAGGASADEVARHLLYANFERARSTDPELAEMLRACAIPRRFDEKIIGVLRGAPDDDERNRRLLDGVLSFSFVLARSDSGYVYHDSTRDLILSDWAKEEDRGLYTQYNERLVEYYEARYEGEKRIEQDWMRVADLIHRASRDRHRQLTLLIEARIMAPLLEALYHATLLSAGEGYAFFERYCFVYEAENRLTACASLRTDGDSGPKVAQSR